MRILIINASPRPKGLISQMLELIKQEAETQGAETVYVQASKLAVRPCIGCMKCRSQLDCILPADDAQRIAEDFKVCDAVVIGSPCYRGNIPGTLKLMFDRIVYALMGESKRGLPQPLHKGKQAILITTCTTPFPFNILFKQSRGAINALKEILTWSGFKIIKTIEKAGTKNNPTLSNSDMINCKKAVRKILK